MMTILSWPQCVNPFRAKSLWEITKISIRVTSLLNTKTMLLLKFTSKEGKNINAAHSQQHALRWRHNDGDGVSNYQTKDCLLNRLFRRRSKKTTKLRVTGLCDGNAPVTGEFPAQRASNVENFSIWWRHHLTDDGLVTQGARGTPAMVLT